MTNTWDGMIWCMLHDCIKSNHHRPYNENIHLHELKKKIIELDHWINIQSWNLINNQQTELKLEIPFLTTFCFFILFCFRRSFSFCFFFWAFSAVDNIAFWVFGFTPKNPLQFSAPHLHFFFSFPEERINVWSNYI